MTERKKHDGVSIILPGVLGETVGDPCTKREIDCKIAIKKAMIEVAIKMEIKPGDLTLLMIPLAWECVLDYISGDIDGAKPAHTYNDLWQIFYRMCSSEEVARAMCTMKKDPDRIEDLEGRNFAIKKYDPDSKECFEQYDPTSKPPEGEW